MTEASPATRARSHAAADTGLPQGANLQGDRGGRTSRAGTGHSLGWSHTRLVTSRVCGRGSQSNHQDILAFLMAVRLPPPYVKYCRP